MCFYYVCLLFSDEMLGEEFIDQNSIFLKLFNILIILNSWNGINLLFMNELIQTIFQVIFKTLTYIIDILFIVFTVILIYSSMGIILFGGHIDT